MLVLGLLEIEAKNY